MARRLWRSFSRATSLIHAIRNAPVVPPASDRNASNVSGRKVCAKNMTVSAITVPIDSRKHMNQRRRSRRDSIPYFSIDSKIPMGKFRTVIFSVSFSFVMVILYMFRMPQVKYVGFF